MLLRPLFRWPAVLAVVVSVAAVDWWLLAARQLAIGLAQLLRDPATLLIVFALSVLSAAFHECGHATACRYGGARPGKIGAGIYLVWPSFFTNVTDSYRLGRAGRLRTDLGGLYFNLIFILLAGLYQATSAEILLLVIAVTHLEMLQQLLPFVRFDGYFILSDLVGVPDLFARVAPILRSVRDRGRLDPRVAGLRRGARIAVTGWVLASSRCSRSRSGTCCSASRRSSGRCGDPPPARRTSRARPSTATSTRSPPSTRSGSRWPACPSRAASTSWSG